MSSFKIKTASDRALLADFGGLPSEQSEHRVWGLARGVWSARLPGVVAVQPAFNSVLVKFDPLKTSAVQLSRALSGLREIGEEALKPREHVLSVLYGGEEGPDLASVACELKLTERQVIELHSSAQYRVSFLGFLPGFAYLNGLPRELNIPRLAEPRLTVPRGSVGIAGQQTGVYPIESPGGWRLIGRTSQVLLDWTREPPTLFAPGDRVRFVPEGR